MTAETGGKAGWGGGLRSTAAAWVGRGLDLLFPPRCPICRRASPVPAGRPALPHDAPPRAAWSAWSAAVCDRCAGELSADVSRCPRCGTPGCGAEDGDSGCRRCRRGGPPWGRIVVLSAYDGAVREAVLRAKRPAGEDVAAALAALLMRKHGDRLRGWDIDGLVPVPMHWLRRSWRGASAAEEVTRRLAGLLHRPWSRSLVRIRPTRMQNQLPVADRPRNVAGAFRCRRRWAGERLLLVDDVVTTGATITACCRALVQAGAGAVDVAAIARADGASAGGE